jgi:triosephosphate isomerase
VRAVAAICADHPTTTGRTVEFFVIPTFPSVPAVVEVARPAGVAVGAQDLHWEDAGAFTGEVSGGELAELGCSLVEVGHAERRGGSSNFRTGNVATMISLAGMSVPRCQLLSRSPPIVTSCAPSRATRYG